MIIKNYGKFWEREAINWGSPGKWGHLRGYLKVRGPRVDFRDQIGVYVLYDHNLAPVYVGQTEKENKRLFGRLKDHESDHLWNRWEHFSWFGFREVTKSHKLSKHDKASKLFRETGNNILNQMEGVLIAAMEPKLNKQGSRWSGATEYFQDIDDHLERPSFQYLATRLESIEPKIDKAGAAKRRGT